MWNILIADDERHIREGLAHLVERLDGYHVCAQAADGMEALAQVWKEDPDIILTDIQMPQLNGLAFVERLKAARPESVIIIISGYDDFSYVRQALRLGVKDYLLKPVDRKALIRLLDEVTCELTQQHEKRKAENPVSEEKKEVRQPLAEKKKENDLARLCVEEIERNYSDPALNVDTLAQKLYVSPNYLRTLFKEYTGSSFVKYLTAFRMKQAAELLITTQEQVQKVAKTVSYEDARYFSMCFKQQFGVIPSQYRELHQKEKSLFFRH